MKRTKEIEVFLPSDYDHAPVFEATINKYDEDFPIKAKLLIELPEKKIELTETMFEEEVRVIAIH